MRGTRSPEASVARAAYENAAGNLQARLLNCASGRELDLRGFGEDVELAAEIDVSDVVPVLVDDAFVASTSSRAIV